MKVYNYLLFRLYWSFRDFSKEGHKMALISTAASSSLFLGFILYVFVLYAYYWTDDYVPRLSNKFLILIFAVVIFIANYYLVIKKELFLKQSFKKGKLGGFLVVMSFFFLGLLFVIGANKNREKLRVDRVVKETIR